MSDDHDIYGTPEAPPAAPPAGPTDLEQALRRQRRKNLFLGAAGFALALLLAMLAARSLLHSPELPPPSKTIERYVPMHVLAPDDRWVLAFRATDPGEARDFKLSYNSVVNLAFHQIMGEQAVRQQQPEVAAHHLNLVARAVPHMAGLNQWRGLAALKRGDLETARKQLEAARSEKSSPEVLNNLAAACLAAGDCAAAEPLLQEAAAALPGEAGTLKNLTMLYMQTGRREQALETFERYVAARPQDAALIHRVVRYVNETAGADEALRLLDRIAPHNPAEIRRLQAQTAAQSQNAEAAAQALRELARAVPPHRVLMELRSEALAKIARTAPLRALEDELEQAVIAGAADLPNRPATPR